jgi:hypothetical protein
VVAMFYENLIIKKKAGCNCKSRGYKEIDFREEVSPRSSAAAVLVGSFINRILITQCNYLIEALITIGAVTLVIAMYLSSQN